MVTTTAVFPFKTSDRGLLQTELEGCSSIGELDLQESPFLGLNFYDNLPRGAVSIVLRQKSLSVK